jgi:hypothetical protein
MRVFVLRKGFNWDLSGGEGNHNDRSSGERKGMIVPFSVVVLVDLLFDFQHGEIGSYLPLPVV